MDEPGFHARRRADREALAARQAGKLGGQRDTIPIAEHVEPPKEAEEANGAYQTPGYRPPPQVPDNHIPGPGALPNPAPLQPNAGPRRMNPHLQLMTQPMLRYDTVKDNIWHGYCMLVVVDHGSELGEQVPFCVLEWDNSQGKGFEHQMSGLSLQEADNKLEQDGVNRRHVQGVRIFTYHSLNGANSFWRFKFEIPLAEKEQEIFYSINNGPELSWYVPGSGQNMRWVGHSCNGFSGGVDEAAFNGPDPLWHDVLREHEKQPLHVLIGGGDQLYCDPLTKEPELQEWVNESNAAVKAKMPLTDEIRLALDRFFFNKYCAWFRGGAFGKAISKIPMLNICDDHDLIDGFGSYPDETQRAPIFSTIGGRGLFWYLLFQMFIVDAVDGTSPTPNTHPSKNCIIGGEGAWVPMPSHSFLSYLGPKVYILLLDCRTERKKAQICSAVTYERCFAAVRALPAEVDHLVFLLGVPIAYPRMGAVETVLESKWNPMTIAAKTGLMAGAVNKFDGGAELLDDLNDHWCAKHHKDERNWLIEQCQKLAVECRLRITYLSGDVHATCVSKFHTKTGHLHKDLDPLHDPKFQLQIVSSAIVNTPPPPPVILMVSTFGKKRHKTLHHVHTDETLIEMFETDTDGSKLKNTTVLGKRNYALVDFDPRTGNLDWSIMVEIKQGSGTTKPYTISAPPPGW